MKTLFPRFGRKTIFCISAVMQLILGMSVAFINNYYIFIGLEFLYGIFGSAGAYITGFVLSRLQNHPVPYSNIGWYGKIQV